MPRHARGLIQFKSNFVKVLVSAFVKMIVGSNNISIRQASKITLAKASLKSICQEQSYAPIFVQQWTLIACLILSLLRKNLPVKTVYQSGYHACKRQKTTAFLWTNI